jgi:hypothetical protein
MSKVSSKLTTALAGFALASLPIVIGAQGTPNPQYPSSPRTTSEQKGSTQPKSATSDQNSPQHHLIEAKRVLNSIDVSSVKGDAKTEITELRSHFSQLEAAWAAKAGGSARSGAAPSGHAGGHVGTTASGTAGTTSGTPAATTAGTTGTPEQAGATGATTRERPRSGAETARQPGAATETATGTTGSSRDDWMTHYQAIDSILDRLIGNASASAGVSGGVSAGATAGTTAGTTGNRSNPPASGATSDRSGVGAEATTSTGASLDASVRGKLVEFRRHIEQFHTAAMGQGRTGDENAASASMQSGVSSSMPQTASSSTAQTPPSSTTTEPTPTTTPAAASVNASASADSAVISRLSAQIDELLGNASTSSTSSTVTGAVGTAGTAASAGGTVCVDRAKLEQLKRDIQALQSGPRQ